MVNGLKVVLTNIPAETLHITRGQIDEWLKRVDEAFRNPEMAEVIIQTYRNLRQSVRELEISDPPTWEDTERIKQLTEYFVKQTLEATTPSNAMYRGFTIGLWTGGIHYGVNRPDVESVLPRIYTSLRMELLSSSVRNSK